ncbi:MAG: hypothetical protein HON53_17615 [Planctomycetaceae bacterium]|jgi:hypothetical protein|nr:hypothetical protein [Planctomycetaceae bacterium]MBT6154518.1 hypothetical protein [Planctomycetaceae bacterium]MBT6486548.1 hypothetical protein [Planctomycetaceae bacterium]MBT6496984.1 hypothetical protein [Planctomycetaceae bacterium]
MKTLPISATDDDIRSLVIEWSELMAAKRFDDAYSMLTFDNREREWTPQLLADTIRGYGVPDIDTVTKQMMLEDWGVNEFEITTLEGREDREAIIDSIEIDREYLGPLDPDRYLGHVHYFDLPLCNDRSDLTARFHILRIDNDKLALELLDIHML